MSLLHSLSNPTIKGQVDLFSLPSTDTTSEYSLYSDYQPSVSIQDSNSDIEFRINSNSNHYLDLSDAFLYLKVKILKSDGTNAVATDDFYISNLFIHSLFSKLDVYFNSTLVYTSNNLYPYRAYLETLLSYGTDYQKSQGWCNLFTSETNRRLISKESKSFELIDKLRYDFATQSRYLLNNVNVVIKLKRSPDSFCIIARRETPQKLYKVKIEKATYFIRKQILFPSIILSHQKLLDQGEIARYPYKKSDVKYFTIPQGNSSAVEENLFLNTIPTRIVFGLVSSSAFNGDIIKDPFEFNPFNVTSVNVSVNNMSIPIRPLSLNFNENEYLLPYYLLFTSLGISGQDVGLSFSPSDFKSKYTLFAFDLTQASGFDGVLNLEKSGTVKLELKFGTALTESIHCIVFSEHQSILEINKFREIALS